MIVEARKKSSGAPQCMTQTGVEARLLLSRSNEPISILLVDDDPDCRLLVRDAIAECKVYNEVSEACNGADALDFLYARGRHAGAKRPGLIFLDIEMPGMAGQATLKAIRSDPAFRDV